MNSENSQNKNENDKEINNKTDSEKTKKSVKKNKNSTSKDATSQKALNKNSSKNGSKNSKKTLVSKANSGNSKKTQLPKKSAENRTEKPQNNVFLIKNLEESQNNDNLEFDTNLPEKSKISMDDGTSSKKNSKKVVHEWWKDALIFIGGTIVLGLIAKFLGGKMSDFGDYTLPPYTPKSIIFPIAWSIIYVAIGVSTYLMWRDKEIKEDARKINLILYFVQMFFNILWPMFFFRLDMPIFAVFWLIVLIGVSCATMFRYFICNLPAGIIFNIYTLWLIYALYMNLGIVLINF